MRLFRFFSQHKKQRGRELVQSRHQADFDWHPAKQNPFTKEDERTWQTRAKLGILVSSCLLFFGILVYHPFFHITHVEVTGTSRLSSEDLRLAALGVMEHRVAFLIPGNSIFFARTSEITSVLSSRFSIDSLHIEKEFPSTVHIVVVEHLATVLYDDGQDYVFVGLDGAVVQKIRKVRDDEWQTKTVVTTSTQSDGTISRQERTDKVTHNPSVMDLQKNVGDFPIIKGLPSATPLEVHSIVMKPLFASRIVSWFSLLKKNSVQMSYGELTDTFGNLTIHTNEGWAIKIDLMLDPEAQAERLHTALEKEIPRPHFEYVDLRYGDRIHWR